MAYLTGENRERIAHLLRVEINQRIMEWQRTYVNHLNTKQTLENFIMSSLGAKGAREIKADLESRDMGQFVKKLFWSRNDVQRFKTRDQFGRPIPIQNEPLGNFQFKGIANPSSLGCEITEDHSFIRKKLNNFAGATALELAGATGSLNALEVAALAGATLAAPALLELAVACTLATSVAGSIWDLGMEFKRAFGDDYSFNELGQLYPHAGDEDLEHELLFAPQEDYRQEGFEAGDWYNNNHDCQSGGCMLHIKRVHEARKRQWGHIASNLITLGAYGFVFRPGFQSARSQLRQSRIKMVDASRVPMPKLSNKIFWQDAKDLRSEKLPCAVCGHKVRGAFKAFLSSKLGSHQTRQRHHCRLCGKIICSDCKTLMMVNHPLTSSDTERKRFLVAQEYSFKRAEWYSRTPNVVNSCIVCATCKADVARESDPELIGRLSQNTNYVENSLREILRNAYPKRGKEGCLRSQAALLVICRGDLTAVLGALIARERGGTPAYLRERFGLIN